MQSLAPGAGWVDLLTITTVAAVSRPCAIVVLIELVREGSNVQFIHPGNGRWRSSRLDPARRCAARPAENHAGSQLALDAGHGGVGLFRRRHRTGADHQVRADG